MKNMVEIKNYLNKEINTQTELEKSLTNQISSTSRIIKKITNSKAYVIWQSLKINEFRKNIISYFQKNKNATLHYFRMKKYINKLKIIKTSKKYKISLIIPTYFAEEYLPSLCKAISAQKYIEDLDLIIIDSESKDKTQRIAKNFGARVFTIKQRDFTHGLARNIAAKKAKYDLILFTVQDALPASNFLFAKMAELLSLEENIAAVSTKQIVRPDADLFARWQIYNHNSALNLNYNSISQVNDFKKFKKEPFFLQRRVSLLDNVCAIYRKNIFDKLGGFSDIIYGEDLDYAFKTLKNGYKLGILCSDGIIHSHNRSSYYFLKRTFISSMLDLDLLSAVKNNSTTNPALDIIAGLAISKFLFENIDSSNFSINYFKIFINTYSLNQLRENNSQSDIHRILNSIIKKIEISNENISNKEIVNYYQSLLSILDSYINEKSSSIYSNEEKRIFLEKMLAAQIGNNLAKYCLGRQTKTVKNNTKLLKEILYGNV